MRAQPLEEPRLAHVASVLLDAETPGDLRRIELLDVEHAKELLVPHRERLDRLLEVENADERRQLTAPLVDLCAREVLA